MVTIGKITKALGLKGEVIVLPLTSFPERFEGLKKVFIQEKEFEIEYIKKKDKFFVFKFKGISLREEAELKLKGKEIRVKEEERYNPPEDFFYVDELEGCTVEDIKMGLIGNVKKVILSSQDLLVVETEYNKEILIPFVKEFCINVDIKNKLITTNIPEGLLDL